LSTEINLQTSTAYECDQQPTSSSVSMRTYEQAVVLNLKQSSSGWAILMGMDRLSVALRLGVIPCALNLSNQETALCRIAEVSYMEHSTSSPAKYLPRLSNLTYPKRRPGCTCMMTMGARDCSLERAGKRLACDVRQRWCWIHPATCVATRV
jgi:hypothetical protein